MNPVEIIDVAKKLWDTAHSQGAKAVDNTAGEYYLLVQQTGADALFSGAKNSFTNKDSLGDISVELAGDAIQGALLIVFYPGRSISIGIEALGYKDISLGSALKGAYKYIKRDVANQYWDYLTNWEATPNDGISNLIPYAKIAMHKDSSGKWVPYIDNATGMFVFQRVSQAEYNEHITAQNNFYQSIYGAKLDTSITNVDGVFSVTLPDGTIYAQGDYTANVMQGGSKNDVLYGGATQANELQSLKDAGIKSINLNYVDTVIR